MAKVQRINSRMIASTGILLAIEILLQLLSILIPGTINVNLSLIPIAFGAILYGPLVGGFLGFASGVVILCSPNTLSVFMSINPLATVFTCLTKTLIAGIVAGFVMKLFKKNNDLVGAVLSSILVPLLNTAIFATNTAIFDTLKDNESELNALCYEISKTGNAEAFDEYIELYKNDFPNNIENDSIPVLLGTLCENLGYVIKGSTIPFVDIVDCIEDYELEISDDENYCNSKEADELSDALDYFAPISNGKKSFIEIEQLSAIYTLLALRFFFIITNLSPS